MTKRRRNEERGTDAGEAILAAATELFGRDGFEAARIDGIARRAGVAKGSVYNHFADKEELFFSAVAREVDGLDRIVDALVAETGACPFPAFVRKLVEAHFRHMLGRRGAATVVLSDSWGRLRDDLRRRIVKRLTGHHRHLADLLAARSGRDGVALTDPERTATALLGLCYILSRRLAVLGEAEGGDAGGRTEEDVAFVTGMILAAAGRGPMKA